jgi:glutamate/tyrosine decarboxylase-like PLP-dependent enzyme
MLREARVDGPWGESGGAEIRRLGAGLADLLAETVEAEERDPVLRRIEGRTLQAMLSEELPRGATPLDDVLGVFRERILPFCRRNGHARFFGYVCTSADPIGAVGDALASALNQPVAAWRSAPSAAVIERLVVRWMAELTGFGVEGEGVLTSGGSMANFHALASAVVEAERRAALPPGSRHRLTVYLSREGHVSLRKAAHLLGVPPDQVRQVAIDAGRRMDVAALREVVARDVAAGLTPAVVCTSAGTANTGAIDALEEVQSYCLEHGMWHHIDGSYGAPAVLTAEYGWMAAAFARADSLSLDPHKWLFVPPDAGCVLVRDAGALRRAFALFSEYTSVAETDLIERYAFFDHGLEMTRRFRGLKIWMILKTRGVDAIRDAIARDIGLRRHLDARVAAHDELEALGSELSIACFRYVPRTRPTADRLDAINRTIVETLVREGRCYLSPTELEGRFALRICIVNYRTRQSDVDFVVDEVVRVGRQAAAT